MTNFTFSGNRLFQPKFCVLVPTMKVNGVQNTDPIKFHCNYLFIASKAEWPLDA